MRKTSLKPETVIRKQRFTIKQLNAELADQASTIVDYRQAVTNCQKKINDQITAVSRANRQAEADARTIEDLRLRVTNLEAELRKSHASAPNAYSRDYPY